MRDLFFLLLKVDNKNVSCIDSIFSYNLRRFQENFGISKPMLMLVSSQLYGLSKGGFFLSYDILKRENENKTLFLILIYSFVFSDTPKKRKTYTRTHIYKMKKIIFQYSVHVTHSINLKLSHSFSKKKNISSYVS